VSKPQGESSSDLQASQINLANTLSGISTQSANEGTQLFNLGLPGLQQSESYYGKLASGDPNALARANAPAIQSITGQSNQALQNIMQNAPRGGARDLAISDAQLSKGAQISNLTTGSYTGAFPSLASLGGQNVSQGNAATSTGLQGLNSAANQYGNLQQLQNQQKATQLGFFGSLAGAGAEGFGAYEGAQQNCWVAAELWNGWYSREAVLIRKYLYDRMRLHWLGRWPYRAYSKYGKAWSEHIKTHLVWRRIAACIFGHLLSLAEEA
jgi:hypothetical protein